MQQEFIERLAQLEDATIGEGAFAPGPAIWVGTREIAHFDANGALDVRLTKAVIASRRSEFAADNRVVMRGRGSDWVEVSVASDSEQDFAFALVEQAVAANLPTAPVGVPPTGDELERRRRFH